MTDAVAAPAASPAPANPAPAPAADPAPPASPLGRTDPAPPAPAPVSDPAPVNPDFLSSLPEDLRGEKALHVFKDAADLAKSYVETKKLVGERIALPKADDADSIARFVAAARPETADAYQIDLPEDMPADFADHMRPAFFETGQQPWQVAKIVEANNAYWAQRQQQQAAEGQASLDRLKEEMGPLALERAKQATVQWLDRLGVPVKFETDLARLTDAEGSLRILFNISERIGELPKIRDTDIQLALGGMSAEGAQARLNEIQRTATPQSVKDMNDPNSALYREIEELSLIVARGQNRA